MKISNTDSIIDYHIHLYYHPNQIDLAKDLTKKLLTDFNVEVGRFHERNVGPHPMWSVQLLVSRKDFGSIFSWVCLNRNDLIVFTHPNTGNDLLDHTDHAIWMGEKLELKLDIFK